MRVILILCFFPGLQKFLFAQETGLVMSGGGAKGIAHVGVIKALEEHNVPIDYVAGTSMGGIVAGMYAAGYSAAQIEGIMLSPLFLRWVNGKFDKGYRYHLYAEEANSSVAVVKLSLDSTLNVRLNSSIASDVALNFALPEYLSRASATARGNFDSLFVPARIMAADVFTQTEIALDSGSLPLALRATLSVPFFYKPVKVGGKYLFDGGLYNNFPVDVMKRDFDPDVIIGCNVSSKVFDAYPYEEDDKLVGNSLLFMLLNKSDPGLIPDSGIYIEPDLSGYNSFDFSKAKALIDSGYQATIRQMEQIKSKITTAVSASERALQRAHFHSRGASFVFDRMEFHGYNSKQQRYMIKLFGLDKRGELTLEDIKKSYFKMMSEKYFATVYPDVGFNARTGKYAFELHGRPRSNLNVKGGGAIATRNISQIFLGAEYYYFDNYLLKNSLSFYAGSFYKSARLQSRLYLAGYNPIFIEPELIYNNWDFINSDDFFLHHETSTVLRRTDRKYALNIGLPLGSKFKTIFSAALINNQDDFGSTAGVISADTLDILKLEGFKGKFLIERNNFNRKQYPTEGKSFRLSVNYLNVEETYEQRTTSVRGNTIATHAWVDMEGAWEQYFKKGKWTTGYLLEGAYTTRDVFSGYFGTLINLPAFNPLQDSPTLLLQNFRAFSFAAMGIKNIFSIKPILDFRLEGHIFKPFEIVSQDDGFAGRSRASADQLFLAATSGLVLHSPLGPVSLSLNYYDDESRWGVLMHIGFLLFNENSLGY